MKTYTIRKLSLLVTLIIFGLALIFIFPPHFADYPWWCAIISYVAFFISIILVLMHYMKKHINDKIEPIYKVIPVQGKLNQEGDIISDVQKDVETWARNQTQEITRLKDLEQYRKEFVGNVSHELKTPIFNIQGYILTLLEGGLEDPKVNMLYLKRTEQSINRMISIVEDLESITKLESGELKLRIESFDIAKLVDEVFELELMIASSRDIKLITNKPSKPVLVKADKKRITEVITNLVTNAVKYGKRGGSVNVSFYNLLDKIMVEIMDDGIGIEEHDLIRIFERFYRVDKSRSREQGGTGLGLSIVKHIIEAHKQSINVKSKIDEGTTFTFTLEKAK
jgi:Signal transduction histidine kinase